MIGAAQHLVLVGLMGVGKTTVARELGRRLGRRVVDTDEAIEHATGRTVRAIFAEDGEPAFRALETRVLLDALAAPEPVVLAAAGGVVLSEENRAALSDDRSRVFWLVADTALLADRVRSGVHRPALDDDPAGTLQRMHELRQPLYREVADVVVGVDGRSIDDVVEAVLR